MRLMTVKEMAAALQIKESTVCSLASQGKLPGFKLGKSWRFDTDTVERLFTGFPRLERGRHAGEFNDDPKGVC